MAALAPARSLTLSPRWVRWRWPLIAAGLLALALLLRALPWDTTTWPEAWDLHLRRPIDAFRYWVIGHRNTHWLWLWFFDPLSAAIDWSIRRIEQALLATPWPLLVGGVALLGHRLGRWRLAWLSGGCLLLMGMMGLWAQSLQTLALMVVSVGIALQFGIPLGIWAARSPRVDAFLRPILDAMQTMPAFVYLIPVLLFFGIARVPSVIATVIYALPPAIRLTNLGIRRVDREILEAARAFGSTPAQILFKVELPLAMPSIMMGINQTVMMVLAMVIIAGLVGGGGLGLEAVIGLAKNETGRGVEAGLAIVIMAMIFDRITQGWAGRWRIARGS